MSEREPMSFSDGIVIGLYIGVTIMVLIAALIR